QRLSEPPAAAPDATAATAAAPTQTAPGRTSLTGAFGPVGPVGPATSAAPSAPAPSAAPARPASPPPALTDLRAAPQSDAQREAVLEEAARNLECTGEVFGDFLLIRRYSAGGFGEVRLARDTALDKNVVVKRLQPEHLENKRAFYQFDIEIEIGRRIKHPNLVPILKSGVINGRRFFTMPEIAGPSLTRVLQGKSPWPLSTMDILGALEAIGRALGFMHRAGVIHADVKPDNLLFASRTRPMLIDLGLARTMNWEETGYRALKSFREDRSIMGTPEFMAPELLHGDPWEIGPSVDIYALGVILYEVLAGRPPFSRPSRLTGEALAAALQKIMDDVGATPPRPILELNPNAPVQLVNLAMQCLSKDPAERPQSADNVSAAIARFLRPAANFTVANKPSALSRMTRWLRKPN
ncbi:MAG: serine/threonine-protein kinase, partial [Planctomycetota bacterium]